MLRYCYLLSLLICINTSFCYEYTSHIDSNKRLIGNAKANHRYRRENIQHKGHRQRDYDSYDKDSVAKIDVASFISAEEDPNGENDLVKKLWNRKYNYNYYGSLSNGISDNNEDYLDIEEGNVEEPLHNSIKLNALSNLDDNIIGQYKKQFKEKKCALNNIKLPFFSHNKSTIAKLKNNKKKKPNSFKKANALPKGNNENLLKRDKYRDNLDLQDYNKIKKRSYIERLCPVCRRKYIVRKNSNSQNEKNYILKNKYDLSPQYSEEHLETNRKHVNIPASNEKSTFENYWSDKRRKREDDNRNIERQKELDNLEKKVESVTVNGRTHNRLNT